MSETGYRPRHNVSRQFTDAETAVSDRATEHLTQEVDSFPSPRLSRYGTADEAYGWLEQDLKRRDDNTARLAREMDLAEKQSLRNQLDAEAREEADRKAAAAKGIATISSDQRGIDIAAQDFYKNNPQEVSNSYLNQGVSTLRQNFKTDNQRELERMNEQINLVTTTLNFDSLNHVQQEMENNPELQQNYVDAFFDEKVMAPIDKAKQANYGRALAQRNLEQANRNMDLFGTAEGGSQAAAIQQMVALQNAGLEVAQSPRLMAYYKQGDPQLEMMLNGFYIKGLPEEKRLAIQESANILTDLSANETQKNQAQRTIDLEAVNYWKKTSKERELLASQQKMLAVMPASVTAYKDALKSNHSILKAYTEKAQEADPSGIIKSIGENAKIAVRQIKIEHLNQKIPIAEHDKALKRINDYIQEAEAKSKIKGFPIVDRARAQPTTEDLQNIDTRIKYARDLSSKINDEIASLLDLGMNTERGTPFEPPADKETMKPAANSPTAPKPFDRAAQMKAQAVHGGIEDLEERKAAYIQWAAENGYAPPAFK
jgi:hypothetical protein